MDSITATKATTAVKPGATLAPGETLAPEETLAPGETYAPEETLGAEQNQGDTTGSNKLAGKTGIIILVCVLVVAVLSGGVVLLIKLRKVPVPPIEPTEEKPEE